MKFLRTATKVRITESTFHLLFPETTVPLPPATTYVPNNQSECFISERADYIIHLTISNIFDIFHPVAYVVRFSVALVILYLPLT